MTPGEHRDAVLAWRAARDARLRDPDGWLTLVGLHWLAPGPNRFGSGDDNEIVLPWPGVPPQAGTLRLATSEVQLLRDGHEVVAMAPDISGEPTVLELGTLRLHVIQRGDRWALRVRDHASPALAAFREIESFEIDPAWRLACRFTPAVNDEEVEIVDVTGAVSRERTAGSVSFERDGRVWSLTALPGDMDGSLWLIFGDATNGHTTYGGGRYLYTDPPAEDGTVVVDFNLAYNPPCVFSPYATCPLPPAVNRLALAIEAGERLYRADAGHEPESG